MKYDQGKSEKGVVMIIIIIVILVLMIIAFTTLMTSRTSMKLSADFRGKTTLYYKAEEGINLTLAKFIRENKYYNDSFPSDPDFFAPFKGYVTCDNTFSPRLDTAGGTGDLKSIRCDFLGRADDTNPLIVMVSRRPDHCKKGTVLNYAGGVTKCENVGDYADGKVFLVNSVARDQAGRQELVQGVIIVPMLRRLNSTGTTPETVIHPYQKPYLAALVRRGEHVFPEPLEELPTATPTATATKTATTKPTKTPDIGLE